MSRAYNNNTDLLCVLLLILYILEIDTMCKENVFSVDVIAVFYRCSSELWSCNVFLVCQDISLGFRV